MNSIRNIIFDLGGVILDIDYDRTKDAFEKLGFKDFETIYTKAKQELIFDLFETGMIRAKDFRDVIRNYAEKNFFHFFPVLFNCMFLFFTCIFFKFLVWMF